VAEALVGADQPEPVDTGLAASLVARRGADDEARAVVSMAYVLAAMIEALEMSLGRRSRRVTRMRKIKRVEEDEGGITREVQETEAQTIEVFLTTSAPLTVSRPTLPRSSARPARTRARPSSR
jgi:hypothetical protein